MSVWTHITGTIRVDCFREPLEKEPSFSKIFVTNLWGENKEKQCTLPSGSEGSLDFRVIENPDKSDLSAYTIVFFGDLRDFGIKNIDIVTKWWHETLQKFTVRQAILEINCEDSTRNIILTETGSREQSKFNYNNRTFAETLSLLRNNKSKSLREMAKEVGMAGNYLWELENGVKKNPSLSCLKKLSEYFNVSINYLAGIDE